MTEYYVATDGDDTRTGEQASNISTPWDTIQHAVNWIRHTGSAGDFIRIRAGTYTEKVEISGLQGTEGAWMTISPYNGEEVIVKGKGLSGIWHGIFFGQPPISYLHISGLEICNSGPDYGIILDGTGKGHEINYLTIDYCHIHDTSGSGFHVWGSDEYPNTDIKHIDFSYNEVHNTNDGITGNEGVSIANCWWADVHHNTVYDVAKETIDLKSGCKSGSIHHNSVYLNRKSPDFYWNYQGHMGIYCDGMTRMNKHIDIYNNYISGGNGGGIVIGAEEIDGGSMYVNVYNNIVILPDTGGYGANGLTIGMDNDHTYLISSCVYSNSFSIFNGYPIKVRSSGSYLKKNYIRNNILFGECYTNIYASSISYLKTGGRLEISDNIYYSTYSTTFRINWARTDYRYDLNPEKFGPRTIFKDPQYIFSANNLHQQSKDSPGVGSGNATNDITWHGPIISTYDYDNIGRSWNETYDIGAYEYDTTPLPEEPTTATGLLVFSGDNRRIRFYNIGGNSNMSFMNV